MLRRHRILFLVLPPLLALVSGLVWLRLRPAAVPSLFVRLDIATALHDPQVLRIDAVNGDLRWRQCPVEEVRVSGTGGAGFAVSGEKSFPFNVPWGGPCGLFCYYDLRPDPGQSLTMELHRQRRGQETTVLATSTDHPDGYFVPKLEGAKGDHYRLVWRGQGRVFVGRPLLYRILPQEERKTMVLLAADTLRNDQIGARVGNVPVAPFLARLGTAGTRFERCLSPNNWTLPSFTSLFTARHEIEHGLNAPDVLDENQPFLVEALSQAYITINFNGGCWMRFQSGFNRGFDHVREGGYFNQQTTVSAKSLLEGATTLLEAAEFPATFLFLHTYQVHTPYEPDLDLLRRLDPNHPSLQSGTFPIDPPQVTSNQTEKDQYFRLYQGEVAVLDREVERFFARLKRSGLDGQTLFVLLGDHGEKFGGHGVWEHGATLFKNEIRVPLLFRFPRGEYAGRSIGAPVSLLDVFPTLLDWAGLPAPAVPLAGVSLMPMLQSGASRPLPVVSSSMNCWYLPETPPQLAITFSRYRFLVTFPRKKGEPERVEAYDLIADPHELSPLTKLPPAQWKQSLPVLLKHRAWLRQNPPRRKGLKSRDIDPALPKQLKTLGYL